MIHMMKGHQSPRGRSHIATVQWVYLIVALFVALIFGLVLFFQLQMDISAAIRAYVGGEGLWAKAQKDAIHNLEHYAVSGDEADYQNFLRLLQVPLGDKQARLEMQKPDPDLDVVREGLIQGRNHPADIDNAISFFRRFQYTKYMSEVIAHWTEGDRLIDELQELGESLHVAIASGQDGSGETRSLRERLDGINRRVTEEEDLFSSTLADASRWANEVSRQFAYSTASLFAVIGIFLSWPIITRIRLTENAVAESEERYRSIFEQVSDIIYTIESDGTFSSISPSCQRMLGWSPAEWIGRPFSLIVHPDDLSDMQALFMHALSGEPLPIFQVRILTQRGGYLEAEIAANPVHRGGSFAIQGVVRDLTERKRWEAEIRKLNEALEAKVKERTRQLLKAQEELIRKEKLAVLGQVAGSVGHELRNPLGVMSNAVYFLQMVLSDSDETVKEYLNIIRNEIVASERIVSDLLDSVRTKPPHLERVGVAELIGQSLSKYTIPSTITLSLEIPEALPRLLVDPLQLQQVLCNLISNGVDAMEAGGAIQIRASENPQEKTITIRVSDSGTGIAPENLDRLFQPLFTTKSRGIGLGLVVVKNLTHANGGRVEVQSEAGQGTTFSIILPAIDEREKQDKSTDRKNEQD
ncbi:MAG: PAS domain S-box protein [Methylococcaceae bacterium]|nr:PAS domain S-box protein [Methylococcaceae bacterium]